MRVTFLGILCLVISLCVGLDAGGIEEKTGGVQYRISEGTLNEISDKLIKNPVDHIQKDYQVTLSVAGWSIQVLLIDVRATYGGLSISFKDRNCVQISAAFPQVSVTFSVTFLGLTFGVQLGTAKDLVIDLTADIGQLAGSSPSLSMECSAKADQIDLVLPIDLLLTKEIKNQLLTGMICPGYKEEFHKLFTVSFGLKSTKFSFNILSFNLTLTLSTVDIGLEENHLFLTQIIEHSTDNKSTRIVPGSSIDGSVTKFPKTNIKDKGFEFWLSEKVIEDFWNEYIREDLHRDSMQLGDIIPALPLKTMGVDTASFIIYNALVTGNILPSFQQVYKPHGICLSEQLTNYFLDKAVLAFPVTDMRIWLTVRPPNITLYLNAMVEVHVNRSCDENDTEIFHIFTIDMAIACPVQIGISDTKMDLKILSFGGNITIRDSNIGDITNPGLIDLARNLPKYIGDSLQEWNKKIKGLFIDSLMPDDLHMENVSVRLEPEHVVIESSLYTGPLKTNVKTDMVWTGYYYKYDPKWLLNLTEIRYQGKLLDEQKCRPPTPPPVSGAAAIYPEMFLPSTFVGFVHLYHISD